MSYDPFYPDGFKNLPDTTTPVTAEFLNAVESALVVLSGQHGSQQSVLDAHTLALNQLEASKSPGIKDWAPGTYRAGWPAIYNGSLFAARHATTDQPIVGQPLAGHVNSEAFTRNNTMTASGDLVGMFDGTVNNSDAASVIENATHEGWAGGSVSVTARLDSGNTNRVFQLGILPAAAPLTTRPLRAANSAFWGIQIGANHGSQNTAYAVANGALGSGTAHPIGTATTGAGVGTYAVEFTPMPGGQCLIVGTFGDRELIREMRPAPDWSEFRVAAGAQSGAVTGTSVISLSGTPTVGAQSPNWRRLTNVSDLA